MTNTVNDQTVASLFSGKLMRAQDVLHAAGTLARVVEQKQVVSAGDRDLAALIGIVTLVQEEFDGLLDEVARTA